MVCFCYTLIHIRARIRIMKINEATGFENEYYYKRKGQFDVLMVRKVLKGTSRAKHSQDALGE